MLLYNTYFNIMIFYLLLFLVASELSRLIASFAREIKNSRGTDNSLNFWTTSKSPLWELKIMMYYLSSTGCASRSVVGSFRRVITTWALYAFPNTRWGEPASNLPFIKGCIFPLVPFFKTAISMCQVTRAASRVSFTLVSRAAASLLLSWPSQGRAQVLMTPCSLGLTPHLPQPSVTQGQMPK